MYLVKIPPRLKVAEGFFWVKIGSEENRDRRLLTNITEAGIFRRCCFDLKFGLIVSCEFFLRSKINPDGAFLSEVVLINMMRKIRIENHKDKK
ncbi:MAG: hypothetical protein V1933_04525 [Candidatus Omnitrophota bacterium]